MSNIKLGNLSMIQHDGGIELWDGVEIQRCYNVAALIHALTFYQKHGELETTALMEEHMYGDHEEEEDAYMPDEDMALQREEQYDFHRNQQ